MPVGNLCLRDNLYEMYTAAHVNNGKKLDLVPNLFGTRIYLASSGWGKFWRWFFDFIAFFIRFFSSLPENYFEKSCMLRAMCFTHRIFFSELKRACRAADNYECYLQQGCPQNFSHRHARLALLVWHEATVTFLKLLKRCTHNQLHQQIQIGFSENLARAPFECRTAAKRMKGLYAVAKLEGLLQESLPLELLQKVTGKQSLTIWENKLLRRFARKIDKYCSKMGSRALHDAVNAIAHNVLKDQIPPDNKPVALGLQMALIEKGCNFFLAEDSHQVRKRDALQPGDRIVCDGRELILGELIHEKVSGDAERHMIYSLVNEPDLVLSIPWGRIAHIEKEIEEFHSWGIESVRSEYIDPKGRFALKERLYFPLNSHEWKSCDGKLHPEDHAIASLILENLLCWLLEQNKTPTNFSPDYLMFNSQGQLKCLKVAQKGPLDFNAVVQFIKNFSRENRAVYKFLMEGIRANDHLFGKFYTAVVELALEDNDHNIRNYAAVMTVVDNRIIDRGVKLYSKARAFVQKCKKELRNRFDTSKCRNINREICRVFMASYRDSASAGILPAFLKEEVIAKVAANKNLKAKIIA